MVSRLKSWSQDGAIIAGELVQRSAETLNTGHRRRSILVLHDIDDWAIDHVFSLWFHESCSFRIKRGNWDQFSTKRSFLYFDLVLFGYFDIYLRFGHDPQKSVVVIHDPCELFPEVPDWKSRSPLKDRIEKLKELRAVIVIAKEMETILSGLGVRCFRIPTMSRLPLISPKEIPTFPLRGISVFKETKRKNVPLLERLSKYGEEKGSWKLTLQSMRLPLDDYVKVCDQHSFYVCTSWQEGGPLPAMDALSRGAVLVSSRVGQPPEFLVHGESALFCESESDFMEALDTIHRDNDLFRRMRGNSLLAYSQARNKKDIGARAAKVLTTILEK